MSVIGKVSLLASANPSKFVSDCNKMADALANIQTASSRVDSALSKSKTGDKFEGAGGAIDGAELGAQIGVQIGAALGASMSQAIGGALGGLSPVASRIESLLDRIGGTVVTLARRLDERIKLPLLDRNLKRTQKVLGFLAGDGRKAEKSLEGVAKAKVNPFEGLRATQPTPILERVAKRLDGVATSARRARAAIEATVAADAEAQARHDALSAENDKIKATGRNSAGRFARPIDVPPAPDTGRAAKVARGVGQAVQGGIASAASGAAGAFRTIQPAIAKVLHDLAQLKPVSDLALGGIALAARGVVGSLQLLAGGAKNTVGAFRSFLSAAQWLGKIKGLFSNMGDVAGKSLSEIDARGSKLAGTLAKMAYVLVPGATLAGLTLLGQGLVGIAPAAGNALLWLTKLAVKVTGVGAVIRAASLLVNPFALMTTGAKTASVAMNGVTATVNKTTGAVSNFGKQVLLALGFFGLVYKVVDFFKQGIDGAVHLNESLSKLNVVFGASTDIITKQADYMAKAFGSPKRAIIDAASSFGLITQAAGFSAEASAELSRKLVKLGADSKSFFDVPLDEALDKIRSGLVGESEPLRAFGVLLSEDAVKAEALAKGFAKSGEKLSEQAKVMARAELIMRGLAPAMGDLERTQDSVANQFAKSAGGIQNFATSIGQVLMPIIERQAANMNANLALIVDAFERNKEVISGWVDWIASGMDHASTFVANFGIYWKVAQLSATQSIANLIDWIGVIPENLAQVGDYLKNNWLKIWVDVMNFQLALIENLGTNIGNLGKALLDFAQGKGFEFNFTPLLEGFKATADKLPDLIKPAFTDMSAEIEAELAKVKRREAGQKKAAPSGLGALATQAEMKTEEAKPGKRFAGALELGSKEEYEARVNSAGKQGDAAMKTANNTAEMLTVAKQQLAKLDKFAGNQAQTLVQYAL